MTDMTRDDIIRMAWEAGFARFTPVEHINRFEKFAELVSAAEREACARVCDARDTGDMTREDMEARRCAVDIRARGGA